MASPRSVKLQLEVDTPLESISPTVASAHAFFASGATRPLPFRTAQLKGLLRMLDERTPELVAALKSDLKRPYLEAVISELTVVRGEINHALSHLSSWAASTTLPTPLALFGSSHTTPEPKGVVLIIAPFNYPIQLVLVPLISALSAGNCAVVKPSEISSACAAVLARLLPLYCDPRAVSVVLGGVPTATELLAQPWDHIFYTGGERVARVVLTAAAQRCTPVTLELGGKSPVFVAADADLAEAARNICFGRFHNLGQSESGGGVVWCGVRCLAPPLACFLVSPPPLPLTSLRLPRLHPRRVVGGGRAVRAHHLRDENVLRGRPVQVAGQQLAGAHGERAARGPRRQTAGRLRRGGADWRWGGLGGQMGVPHADQTAAARLGPAA